MAWWLWLFVYPVITSWIFCMIIYYMDKDFMLEALEDTVKNGAILFMLIPYLNVAHQRFLNFQLLRALCFLYLLYNRVGTVILFSPDTFLDRIVSCSDYR